MELFFAFLNFLARLAILTTSIHFFSRQATAYGYLPGYNIWLSVGVAYLLIAGYGRLIAPRLQPWRHLPAVKVPDIRLVIPVTDFPRGEAALQWATEYQDEDMIRLIMPGGNTSLFLISPTAIRDMFGTNQNDFIKPIGGSNFLARILGYGLVLSEGSVHQRQRKSLTHSFRVQNIRALHDLMLIKTKIFLANMERENASSAGKGIDITKWASRVTLDIIGNALMSKEYDSLNHFHQPVSQAFEFLTTASPEATRLFMLNILLPNFIVKRLPLKVNAEIDHNVAIIRQSCEASLSQLEAQLKQGQADSANILASIVADPGASHTEVIDQMTTFLGAGHETTATSIAWVTHLLTLPENQQYQTKLREEIHAHPDCTASPIKLEGLPWLNAICEETLRLYPPVTNTARKAIRDTTVAGVRIKPGQIITAFPWAINRNPKFWGGDQAGRFVPERWLDKKADGSLFPNNHGGAESAYCNMTFLHGNRSCIGKGFAKAELRLVVAKLFGDFVVSRLPGDDFTANPVGALTIKPEGGLFVTLERVG